MAKNIPDYYKILQVDSEAVPEVIKAAYRRLSSIYHPDNSNSDNKMVAVNEAYAVLSDTEKRSAYHKDWLKCYSDRDKHVRIIKQTGVNREYDGYSQAVDVMEDFFYALKAKDWESAYLKLTEEDKARITFRDFCDWREAVGACFEMQDYKITFSKSYNNGRLGNAVYEMVEEYQVQITDMDCVTSQSSTEKVHKYAAFDGVAWRVCLGVSSVNQMTVKYRLMADRKSNYNPMDLYKNAVERIEPITGLMSKSAFSDEAERELYRSGRYGNTFSFMALQILPQNREKQIACTCKLAEIVKTSLRKIDVAGYWNDSCIVCMLVETDKKNAISAAGKIVDKSKEHQEDAYEIKAGIVDCSKFDSVEAGVKLALKECELLGYYNYN